MGGVDHYRVRAGGAQVVVEQTADGSDPCIAFDRPADALCIEVEAYDRVGYTALAALCLQPAPIEPDGGPDMAYDMAPDNTGGPDMAYDGMTDGGMAGDGMPPGAEPEASATTSGGCGVDPGRLPTPWPLLLIGLLATRLRR